MRFSFKQRLFSSLFIFIIWALIIVLFAGLEFKREAKNALQIKGLQLSGQSHPSFKYLKLSLVWKEKGVDKFGLPIGGHLEVFTPDNKPTRPSESLKARFLQVKGNITSSHGSCLTYNQGLLCAAKNKGILRGVYLQNIPIPSLRLWLYGFIPVVLLSLLILFLARWDVNYKWDALVVGISVLLSGILALYVGDRFLLYLQDLTTYHGNLSISGTWFFLLIFIGSAGMAFAMHFHIMELFSNFKEKPFVYLAISPAMIGMFILVFIPFFMGVYIAFLDNNYNFVGLQNFKEILFPSSTSDLNFYFTFGVTVLWTVLNVTLHVTIGLILALILSDARIRERAIYRVLLVIPWAVPSYITALIWKWMFNTQYGPINMFLKVIGLPAVDWLGRSFITNFTANLVTNTWLGFPFMMVVSLGAVQSIPSQLYEAAEIDGANRWQRFRHITLPLLKPALFPAIILGTIWTFNMFNVVYLVSGGAPDNKTNILITEAYRAFRVLKNYGLAAAYSLLIFLILLIYSLITNRITKGTEDIYA